MRKTSDTILILMMLLPATALAQYVGDDRDVAIWLGMETVLPDVRFEVEGERGAAVLGWPVTPIAFRGPAFGPEMRREQMAREGLRLLCWSDSRYRAFFIPFVEPQIRMRDWDRRLLLGMSVPMVDGVREWGVLVEGAAVLTDDGVGGVAGVGLTAGPRSLVPHASRFGITVRQSWLPRGETRTDVAIDFAFPFYPKEWTQVLRGIAATPNVAECAPSSLDPPLRRIIDDPTLPPADPPCEPRPCKPGDCGFLDDGCGGKTVCFEGCPK